MWHKVDAPGPRILISVHFGNKKDQSLKKFNISSPKDNKRRRWYNWLPEVPKQKKKVPQRLMNKPRWSKPYFTKKI
jgi:hypothetical protein